jgi:hypothetical protein
MKNPFKKEVIFRADSSDLDNFINKEYGTKIYEFVADQESGNDVSHSFTVSGKLSDWDKKALKKFNVHYPAGGPITHILLNDLCRQGKIESGRYIVDVCW